ncbi:hypothetical protein JOE58_002477 [Curtobacterium luteum]|uniref:Uncharacterized protein n=1 Tax=Curtobacterium luteum TaxID=33881 RepID=A0A8H9G774_9MICO|nr:hypothetical protein [Curtobacterium luteum]MBM7803226.1 hypothetical protein [Curtobacterium luteum]NUU50874.1 hypothetical protein [Curtobacterium luteum]GGK95045.1 hypothetical protein GCM10009769_11340 [Curtobacterium luteum]
MNAALHLTQAGPLERAAHATGVALLRWSERRAARVLPTTIAEGTAERTVARLAHEARTALAARERHAETLSAGFPRVR